MISVSFSGGRTSGMMAKLMKDSGQSDMRFVFANTSREKEETLVFVDRCDREFGLNLVWLEAAVHPERGIATTHRIVSFETAKRNGEVFEDVIRKYGIPNQAYPHCTRELKLAPMESYFRSIGWTDYQRAVGIRIDEPKRLRKDAESAGIVYPLAHWFPTDKAAVNSWWEDRPFNLDLKEFEGNCRACWKKSLPKLIKTAQTDPEAFEWTARMETEHGLSGHNLDGTRRTFFREHRSSGDIVSIAEILSGQSRMFSDADADSGCSESCEAFV
jgi:hypothetical protein